MDFKELFAGVAIVAVFIIAIFSFTNDFNSQYSTQLGTSDRGNFTAISSKINSTLSEISRDAGNTTESESGAGIGNLEDNALSRSLRGVFSFGKLIGLVPEMIREGAIVLGIPENVVDIGVYVFIFAFALTLAFLLLLGVQKLIGRT